MLISGQLLEDESKPPDILTKVTLLQPLASNYLLNGNFSKSDGSINCQLFLYNTYVLILVDDEYFMVDFQSNISFQIEAETNSLTFRSLELHQIEESFLFKNPNQRDSWFNELRSLLPQNNFYFKYKILDIKAKSHHSKVYKIQRLIDSQILAAKVTKHNSSLKNQIKMLSLLQHPNLIYFRQYYIEKSFTYIVMDYQDGGTLLDQLKSKSDLTPKERAKIYIDVLNGLQFLRIKEIVHRDIKPQNILYSSKDKNYKIADFGLAKYSKEHYDSIAGTPGYIPPQLFSEEQNKITNIKSDIYSAGLMFYEVMTGQRYFQGQTQNEILKKNLQNKVKLSIKQKNVLDTEKKLLAMMLHTSTEKRKDSYQILQSVAINTLIKFINFDKQTIATQRTRKSSSNQEDEQSNYGFMDAVKQFLRMRTNSST